MGNVVWIADQYVCVGARCDRHAPTLVIVLTVTDPTSGDLIEQGEFDPRLEFDDPFNCKSIVARVGPVPTRETLPWH